MKTFHLTIASIGTHLFDGEAVSATLPGKAGEFTVLANHEPFVSELKQGVARVKTAAGNTEQIPVREAGIAEISNNQATVLL